MQSKRKSASDRDFLSLHEPRSSASEEQAKSRGGAIEREIFELAHRASARATKRKAQQKRERRRSVNETFEIARRASVSAEQAKS